MRPRVANLTIQSVFRLCIAFISFNSILFAQGPPPNNVTYYTDPSPTLSSGDSPQGHELVLRKELSGYGKYGVADGRSDILYTGEVATWHFDLPASVPLSSVQAAYFRVSLIADDHYSVSLDNYRLAQWIDGLYGGNNLAGLPHGYPFNGPFSNWVQRDFPITDPSTGDDITLFNTSGVGNWFAIDWIELHLVIGPSSSTPITVSPERGGTAGLVTVSIQGPSFSSEPATVSLTTPGEPDIIGFNPTAISSQEIATTFDLRDSNPGVRNVQIVLNDASVISLPNAFTVVPGGGGVLDLEILGPSVARVNRDTTFTAYLRNAGLNDIGVVQYEFGLDSTQSAALAAASSGPTLGGISPGSFDDSSAIFRFPSCKGLTFKVTGEEEPDLCEPIRKKIRKLKVAIGQVQHDLDEALAKYLFFKCDTPPPTGGLGTITCLDLLHEIDQLRAELADLQEELTKAQKALSDCEAGDHSASLAPHATTSSTGAVQLTICPVFSWDPNDKVGPLGSGLARFVEPRLPLPYTVFFENKSDATAPAQQVVITDPLDPGLDIATFAFGSMHFGDHTVSVPANSKDFATVEDLRPDNNLIVTVQAHLDVGARTATWQFASLDPDTGLPPSNPLAGFLPPNKVPPQGEGSVSFLIQPLSALATGKSISNQAQIVFDDNPNIPTPIWMNTIDASAPASRVASLPPQSSTNFSVRWSGDDVGAGIQDFSVFVSDNSGPFTPWLSNVTSTEATFTGENGHSYGFFSLGRDLVGNIEPLKSSAEATTTVAQGTIDVSTQVSVTTTGFLYSRVTGTFNGTIRLKNISTQPINGPLQLVLSQLASGVSLLKPSGTYRGSPYITVPGASTLSPGQTATISVQFNDPSKVAITFKPVTYSGSF